MDNLDELEIVEGATQSPEEQKAMLQFFGPPKTKENWVAVIKRKFNWKLILSATGIFLALYSNKGDFLFEKVPYLGKSTTGITVLKILIFILAFTIFSMVL